MIKKNYKSIAGLTLIEILIGIVITTIMMGAMYTSYAVVNQSYSQVSAKAKISKGSSCLLYTSPSPRDDELSRMPSSA